MLTIEVENKTIKVSSLDSLKKYQISQLEYFNFTLRGNELENYTSNLNAELLRLVDFFNEENIEYNLNDIANRVIESLSKNKIELEGTFSKAKKLKELGILDDDFKEFKEFADTLPRKLKPHQLKSAFHFYLLKNGANFSVPGSGKTTTLLTVYEKLKKEGQCNILFVVGPPSCFQPWKTEFVETLGREPSSVVLSGGNKSFRKSEYYRSKEDSYELYLSTFHTVLNDYKDISIFFSQRGINVFLIIDEAHYMKQLGGAWANSLLEIGKFANYKGILTGTPIPKSYKDLFNLFDFLWEENSPFDTEIKIKIEALEKKGKNEEVKEILDSRIGPLFYRVRKKDLGLLPAVFHEPIKVVMNPIESFIYKYVKSRITELNQSDYFKNETLLHKLWKGRMMRLRQVVSYPKLLLSAIDEYSERLIDNSDLQDKIIKYDEIEVCAKLQALSSLVMQIRSKNEKVLIWSNFVGSLKLIKSHFNSLGENAELIYGKTPIRKDDFITIGEEKTREDIRDEFLDKKSGLNILIANPAACAESISLHKSCFHAIYYDLSYNCAQYLQSLDRIHRVGGSENKTANYYFLQYENSIDEDILINLESKAQKMYSIVEDDYEIYNLDMFEEENDDIGIYKKHFIKE